ncbi:hypothetical protein Tco_1038276 [Tanacetum coccineum]
MWYTHSRRKEEEENSQDRNISIDLINIASWVETVILISIGGTGYSLKDEKSSKNGQNQARNGKAEKTKSNRSQRPKSQSQQSNSEPKPNKC